MYKFLLAFRSSELYHPLYADFSVKCSFIYCSEKVFFETAIDGFHRSSIIRGFEFSWVLNCHMAITGPLSGCGGAAVGAVNSMIT